MPLLREISDSAPESLLALRGLEETAPILQDAQFYAQPGSAARIKRARTGTVVAKVTRSLNEANTATPPTPNYDTPAKSIVSFDASVDVLLEDRNEDIEAELAHQTYLEAREAGWVLQTLFFEGNQAGDAEDFDGFRQIVDVSWILNGGSAVPVGGDAQKEQQQIALETFKQHARRVRGGVPIAYMNDDLLVRWITVAKNLGYYRQSKDALGDEIELIGNIVVKGAGQKQDGSQNLPFTETGNTSSIFFVRWGVRVDTTCLTSVGVKGRYAGQSGNLITNNVNLDCVLHLQDLTALVQSQGWSLSTL